MVETRIPCETSPYAQRWTREDCAKLEAAGFLNGRYELIEGIVDRRGQNMPHANVIRLILTWLFQTFGDAFVVTQASIDVCPDDMPTSEPMPDAIVLTRPAEEFDRYPRPAEIRLVIEVSDTTLRYDLTTKAALYARAEIADYWIVSLRDRQLIVHRAPKNGVYQTIGTLADHEQVAPLGTPDKPVFVSRLLPAARAETSSKIREEPSA